MEYFDELSHVGTVQVTTGPDSTWSAYSETLWLSIISYGGKGSGSVQYAVEHNTNTVARLGFLSVAGKTVSIYQDATHPDTNGDGLSDDWQIRYFISPDSPNAAPGLDYDHDGLTNSQEYLAGTDPTDPFSVLTITGFVMDWTTQTFQLLFPTRAAHDYQVQRTADLKNPEWKGFTNTVFGTGSSLPAIGPLSTNNPNMFYRIQLVR